MEKSPLSEKNKAIVRRQEDELFTRGNLDTATELYSPDYVGHDPSNPPEKGTQSLANRRTGWVCGALSSVGHNGSV